MDKVRFHLVDIGAPEDLRTLLDLMESKFGENEYMLRNNQLFVSRMLRLSPEVKDASTNDKIVYPFLFPSFLYLLFSPFFFY